jgi:nitroreductase
MRSPAEAMRTMTFFDLVKVRHSVRSYLPQAIHRDSVDSILSAINLAPSAGNLQAYEVSVIEKPGIKSALAKAAFQQTFIEQAPVVLVFAADPRRSGAKYGERGETLYCIQDATIAATYAQLAATALGLGSCWVGAFDERAVAMAAGTSAHLRPVVILPLGHAAEQPQRPSRRQQAEFIRRDGK